MSANVGLLTYTDVCTGKIQLKNHRFLRCVAFSWSKLTNMSDNSNDVPFRPQLHFQPLSCHQISPYLAWADNNIMQAANIFASSKSRSSLFNVFR